MITCLYCKRSIEDCVNNACLSENKLEYNNMITAKEAKAMADAVTANEIIPSIEKSIKKAASQGLSSFYFPGHYMKSGVKKTLQESGFDISDTGNGFSVSW